MKRGATSFEEAARFADDPDWYKAVPEGDVSRPRRAIPSAEDCSPVDPETVAHALSPDGPLRDSIPGYEPRPGQIDMARAVTRALNGASHLMIEAGTGVGKSLAYLVPALHWAALNDTPVIVATATRNLQAQLVEQDLPRALATLPQGTEARTALLKGRRNYLCLRMAGEFMRDGAFALDADERDTFAGFVAWLKTTPDGDLDALMRVSGATPAMSAALSCPGEECAGRRCRYHRRCFVMKARAAAARAHLVVANHALVLAEATGGGAGTILPAYGRIVFDEAHDLEDAATDFLSFLFSRGTLARELGRISRMRGRGARRRETGILDSAARLIARGALAGSTGSMRDAEQAIAAARAALPAAEAAGDELCARLSRLFDAPGIPPADTRVRYRVAGGTEKFRRTAPNRVRRQYNVNGLFADYPEGSVDEAGISAAEAALENALAKAVNALSALSEALNTAYKESQDEQTGEIAVQAAGAVEAIRSLVVELKFTLSASDPDYVYWAVRSDPQGEAFPPRRRNPKLPSPVRVTAAPLSVAPQLHKIFYDQKDTVVLCSATLRTGSSFSYSSARLGFDLAAPERAAALVASSPFDYLSQSLVLTLPDFANPAASVRSYAAELAPFIVRLADATEGRMLVLFTSYEMLCATEEAAADALAAHGKTLLAQNAAMSRESMAEAMRNAKTPTVLFGAQSFWEGVDIPGPALSCVVIARLPFPQAGEPIVAARCEQIEERGGSAFREYTLPEAVLKFRQGFGRLIRSRSDRGVVVVADPRIGTKNYGKSFMKALPAPVHSAASQDELVERVRGFLCYTSPR